MYYSKTIKTETIKTLIYLAFTNDGSLVINSKVLTRLIRQGLIRQVGGGFYCTDRGANLALKFSHVCVMLNYKPKQVSNREVA